LSSCHAAAHAGRQKTCATNTTMTQRQFAFTTATVSSSNLTTLTIDMTAESTGKGKGLDSCYSTAYMSQTRDQQRSTISEVAADWHEPMVPQRIM